MWSTAASWVALLALTAALTRYYNPDLFRKLTGAAVARPERPGVPPRSPVKKQKSKRTLAGRVDANNNGASTPTSLADTQTSKKRKIVSPATDDARGAPADPALATGVDDGGMSNKELAQQLSRAQAGTKLEPAKGQGLTKKERRAAKVAQNNAGPVNPSGVSTETSSTTGQDADDDLSPIGSPSTAPVSTAPTSRAGDVSDMLEAPAAKPHTIRLTNIGESVRKNVPKVMSQVFQPVTTKKQRQRQARAAEQKAIKAEADRVQEAKKQAQLRTARLAEGTSNQLKANAFAANQNAWQSGKLQAASPPPAITQDDGGPLLDTFDVKDELAPRVNGAVSAAPLPAITKSVPATANVNETKDVVGQAKTTALAASNRERLERPVLETRSSWADEVNEEEQDQWANDLVEEEKWESVTSKKQKKKSKKDNDTSSEASGAAGRRAPPPKPPVVNGGHSNGIKPRVDVVNRFQTIEPAADASFKDAEWEA